MANVYSTVLKCSTNVQLLQTSKHIYIKAMNCKLHVYGIELSISLGLLFGQVTNI
jgi:hypothetical protein